MLAPGGEETWIGKTDQVWCPESGKLCDMKQFFLWKLSNLWSFGPFNLKNQYLKSISQSVRRKRKTFTASMWKLKISKVPPNRCHFLHQSSLRIESYTLWFYQSTLLCTLWITIFLKTLSISVYLTSIVKNSSALRNLQKVSKSL